jgi:hypothetical protein
MEWMLSSCAGPAISDLVDATYSPVDTKRFRRASDLDGLPQLIKVLRGEKSLMGPRPCLSYENRIGLYPIEKVRLMRSIFQKLMADRLSSINGR